MSTQLDAAKAALTRAEAQRDRLQENITAAVDSVAATSNGREDLIRRAAHGDAKATHEAIRRADAELREAELQLEIEQAKGLAMDEAIADAKLQLMRAEGAALGDAIRAAYAEEAKAFQALLATIDAANDARAVYDAAVSARTGAYLRAKMHNSRAEVQKTASPNRAAENMWTPPRPVTITVGDHPTLSMTSMNGEPSQSPAAAQEELGDASVLAALHGSDTGAHLGEVCTALYRMDGSGWNVRTIAELKTLGEHYANQ